VQALAGTAAVRPKLDIGTSPMYRFMVDRPDGGIWIGRTTIDGVPRIMAFHRVPGRDLIVLVGVAEATAMAPAASWGAAARSLAFIASLLVLAIAMTLLWELWNWRRTRRRQRALAQSLALLAGLQGEMAGMRLRAAVAAAQLQVMLEDARDAVALVDGGGALTAWNPHFATASLLPDGALREGLPLEALLRALLLAGRFGAVADDEAAVARFLAALGSERGGGSGPVAGPAGAGYRLDAVPMPDGGLVLLLLPADAAAPLPARPMAPHAMLPAEPDSADADTVEL
jgi:PAS domain-containing protein